MTFQVPAGERQLFLDDVDIAKIENLQRTMHRPAKKGAVIRPHPGKGGSIQIRHAPFWCPEENAFKLLIMDTSGESTTCLWYTSSDGLHWISGQQPDRTFPLGGHVVYDRRDSDPRRRYKAVLLNRGFAVSSDGIHWEQLDLPSIPSFDEGNFSYGDAGPYIHTMKIHYDAGDPHQQPSYVPPCEPPGQFRCFGLATSEDFEQWTYHGLTFHADEQDQILGRERIRSYLQDPILLVPVTYLTDNYTVDVYNFAIFRYEGVYIGIGAMHHRSTNRPPPGVDDSFFSVLQLACSRDLGEWTRLGAREPWIDLSPVGCGAFDTKGMLPPSAPLPRGSGCPGATDRVEPDQLWFYYTGGKAEPDRDSYGVCLATLRRDGFVSLDADDSGGMVETRSFPLQGSRLFVNLDAPQGELVVELLNGSGQVSARSEPLTCNSTKNEVSWVVGDVARLMDQEVNLRFTLRNARLFSYWLQ